MAVPPVVIGPLRTFAGRIEVIGFGGVRAPRGDAQEVEVAVLTSAVAVPPDRNAAAGPQLSWIGCGQLDLVPAGSLWERGRRVGDAPSEEVVGKFRYLRAELIGVGADEQAEGRRPFPSRLIADAPGFLLMRVDAEKDDLSGPLSRAGAILIPGMELVRALFGVSSGFLLEMFDGIRSAGASLGRGLVDFERSFRRDDGAIVIRAARKLLRDEAMIVAIMIADGKVLRFYRSVFQQLSVDSEWRMGRSCFLRLDWPLSEIALRANGRWVGRVDAPDRFVVERIVALGFDLSFSDIEVHHPGPEAGPTVDLPPALERQRRSNAAMIVLVTGKGASSSRLPTEFNAERVDLPGARGITVRHVPHGREGRQDRNILGEDRSDEREFSTGGLQPRSDPDIGRAGTRRRRIVDPLLKKRTEMEALDLTWNALVEASRLSGWRLLGMSSLGPTRPGAAHGGLKLDREPLVAVIRDGGKRVIVADMGSPSGAERSLGILRPMDDGATDGSLAASARLFGTKVDGRWRSPDLKAPGFFVKSVNRPLAVWTDNGAYANLLRVRIASALEDRSAMASTRHGDGIAG